MLNNEIIDIIDKFRDIGWIPEPEAKRLFRTAGLSVPEYVWARTPDEAIEFAHQTGYPVVAKVVSPAIIHKSDVGGVIVGINSDGRLEKAFNTFKALDGFDGMLVEEMVSGRELIIGAKIDYQFGPVVLLGIGGTGVEVYQDVTMRMTPITEKDVMSMIQSLKGKELITGFRGNEPVSVKGLTDMIMGFSSLITAVEERIESIDLNPVICSRDRCIIADARIILDH
jgi:acetate---CoA ligase (ADP-forming) subunit beta